MNRGLDRLTDREKEALRLLIKGYDVKSCAHALSVTPNTITERFRSARQKLGVTSSREAARMLARTENVDHRFSGDRLYAVEPKPVNTSFAFLPDNRVEAQISPSENRLREAPASFLMQPEFFTPLANLPLRKPGELRNGLTQKQRAFAIIDVAVKLSMVVALICLLALVVNMFAGAS